MKLSFAIVTAFAIIPALSCPVTEVITAVANDALNADHSLINTVKINSNRGTKLLEEAWGPQIEQPGIWQGFITWDVEGHPSPSLESDEDFQKAASKIFTHVNFSHVEFEPFINLTKTVNAPVTEIIYVSLRNEADRTEYEAAVQHGLDAAGGAFGCLSGAHGSRLENKTSTVMVVGWVSKEAHEAYALTSTVAETISRFVKVGNIDAQFHASLTNFVAEDH